MSQSLRLPVLIGSIVLCKAMSIPIVSYGNIAPDVVAGIESAISRQQNLKDMMSWALSQPSGTFLPQIVSNVVVQDEFTHDVIVPRNDGVVLVYDTT